MNSKYNHVASKTSVSGAMQMGLVCVSADMQARVDLEADRFGKSPEFKSRVM